jgi:hypothetical protein
VVKAVRHGTDTPPIICRIALDLMPISDYGAFHTHAVYIETLQTLHARKSSFWAKLGSTEGYA